MSTHIFTREQIAKEQHIQHLMPARAQHKTLNCTKEQDNKLHNVLHSLVTTLTLPQTFDDMLQAVATLIMQATTTDFCVILLQDKEQHELMVRTIAPDMLAQGNLTPALTIDQSLWNYFYSITQQGQLPHLTPKELQALNPLPDGEFSCFQPIPLMIGAENVGLINCYASTPAYYNDNDQLLLVTIANQAALAIRHRQHIEESTLSQKARIKAFVDDLLFGDSTEESLQQRAHILGCRLAQTHIIAIIEITEINAMHPHIQPHVKATPEEWLVVHDEGIEHCKQHIQAAYSDALLVEHNNQLLCLFSLEDTSVDQLTSWLETLIKHSGQERHIYVAAGIGNPCYKVTDYRRGYAEAHEALELERLLQHESGCSHFNTLGAYRYLYKFAHTDTLCDQFQDQIAAICDYDCRKKTNLLSTLETYLECGGNAAKTACILNVHRNTLLQRLERLQKLCALDLEHIPNRLPLLMALKIHKLRVHSL